MALFSVWGWGQTTIFNYQNTTATIPTSFILNNGNATNDIDKSSYLLLDAGGTGTDDITTADLSLSSYNKLTISFQIQSFVSGNYTPLKIEYLTSGSAWTTWMTTPVTTSSYVSYGYDLNSILTNTTKVRLTNG